MPRILITGAAGSGTTTLGRAVAARLGCPQHETDDYLWYASDPPYQRLRRMPDRLHRLHADLIRSRSWVISGALTGWGNPLVRLFGLVVLITLDPALRMRRLRAREAARWGARIEPGGDMAGQHRGFMEWAEAYDTAGPEQRSLALHEQWVATLPCPVLRLDGAMPTEQQVEAVLKAAGR